MALGRRHPVERAVVLQVLPGGVAAVEAGKVGNHAELTADGIEVGRQQEVVEPDLAGVGPQDAAQAAQGGRLAGAVLAQQQEDLAGADLEVHAGHRLDAAEALAQATDGDHGGEYY